MVKLFVVGYPLDLQEAELIEMFSNHGMLHSISLITDKVTFKPKGYGFIDMIDRAGAERAINALDGIVIKGRRISVKLASDKPNQDHKRDNTGHFQDRRQQSAEKKGAAAKKRNHQKQLNSNTSKTNF